MTRKEILPGVFVTCLPASGEGSGLLSLYLVNRLCRENAAQNALIPYVLVQGTVRYSDAEALSARLDSLGAQLTPQVRKLGEIQCVGLRMEFAEDEALEDIASLLGETLLSPNTRGGLFQPKFVENAKETVMDIQDARDEDERACSLSRLTALMCDAEDYAVDALGTTDGLDSAGYVALTRHYRTVLAASPVEVFYCGPARADRVERAVTEALITLPRGELDLDIGTDIRMNALEAQPRHITEEGFFTQNRVAIGYRLGEGAMLDPDMAALAVLEAVLNGRLAADTDAYRDGRAHLDPMKGLLLITCAADDVPAAAERIDALLRAVGEGDVSAQELSAAKAALSQDLLEKAGAAAETEAFWLGQCLLGLEYGPAELAALGSDVPVAGVANAVADAECDTVYCLAAGMPAASDG